MRIFQGHLYHKYPDTWKHEWDGLFLSFEGAAKGASEDVNARVRSYEQKEMMWKYSKNSDGYDTWESIGADLDETYVIEEIEVQP